MKLVALADDLFFIGKIESIINNLGLSIKFLQADDIENRDFDYAIVDMHHKDAFRIIKKFPHQSLCFGSHVKKDLFEKARDLGCKRALPRSAFFEELPKILK